MKSGKYYYNYNEKVKYKTACHQLKKKEQFPAVFNLKMSSDSASLVTFCGRLFQRNGKTTDLEKARRPQLFMLEARTTEKVLFEDLRSHGGWYLCRRSFIKEGARS